MGRLAKSRVLIVGLGGVGGYTAEFLARAGIGHITIVDGDSVDPTNRNRQLVALTSTEGQPKSAVLADRIRDINPNCRVTARQEFVPADPIQVDALVASDSFDFVVDAIDSLQPKVRFPSIPSAIVSTQAFFFIRCSIRTHSTENNACVSPVVSGRVDTGRTKA
jgi:tRNA A37 threonylcarbamoyladenosine dehydratase